MNERLREALKKVCEEIRALSPEEFKELLAKHQDGDIARVFNEAPAFIEFCEKKEEKKKSFGEILHKRQEAEKRANKAKIDNVKGIFIPIDNFQLNECIDTSMGYCPGSTIASPYEAAKAAGYKIITVYEELYMEGTEKRFMEGPDRNHCNLLGWDCEAVKL